MCRSKIHQRSLEFIPMDYIQQEFNVRFEYKVYFTSALFNSSNPLFDNFFKEKNTAPFQKILFVIDHNVANDAPFNIKLNLFFCFSHCSTFNFNSFNSLFIFFRSVFAFDAIRKFFQNFSSANFSTCDLNSLKKGLLIKLTMGNQMPPPMKH